MSDKAYVIRLGGYKRDDDQTFVVSEAFAKWVDEGTEETLSKVIVETIAKGTEEEDKAIEAFKMHTPGSGSSPDNDRALTAIFLYKNLDGTSELLKEISGREIVWEYEGYVY